MKKNFICWLCFFNTFFVTAQVDISLHLETGKSYSFSVREKTTIIQTIDGIENLSVSTIIGKYSYKVIADWDSLYLMDTHFIELTQQVESEAENSYHSSLETDPNDVMCTILNRLVNQPFRVIMRKDFTWKNVTGLDSIFFRSYASYNLPPDKKKVLDSLIIEIMDEFIDKGNVFPVTIYPSKTVRPNDVWTVFSETEHGVPTYDSCSYMLAEIYGDEVIIKASGTTSSLEKETINEGIGTSYHLKGTTEGTIRFDKKSGWIMQGEIKTVMEGKTMVREVNSTQKQLVPMKIIKEGFIIGNLDR